MMVALLGAISQVKQIPLPSPSFDPFNIGLLVAEGLGSSSAFTRYILPSEAALALPLIPQREKQAVSQPRRREIVVSYFHCLLQILEDPGAICS